MGTRTIQRRIHIPQVSGVIERPRLVAQIQAASAKKLSLICAPPGYGKTTLAAQFARRVRGEVIWLTLEDRQRDFPNLFHKLITVLARHVPDIESLPTAARHTPAELAALITDFLRDNTSHDYTCILDDTHVLAGSTQAETFLQTLVEFLPPNWHIVLIGRILPNLPLTEMIARRQVVAFGQSQLRFTPDEIHRLAAETHGVDLKIEDIEYLANRLEGWPAGIVLALHPLPSDLEQAMLHGGTGPEALFNALARSMLDSQPPGLREFLLASSTLFRMTPELCDSILGLTNSVFWINEAKRRNLFLTRVAGGIVYHGLFRDFLQNELRQIHADRFTNLHVQAAQWFESKDRLDESFEHYMAAGLVERAAAISEQVADAYFAQGYAETLLKWYQQMGQVSVFAPRLLYNCARIYADRYEYDQARNVLDKAERGFAQTADDFGIADVHLYRAFIKYQSGQLKDAIAEAIVYADEEQGISSRRARAYDILGLAHLRLGEGEVAIAYLEQALKIHRSNGDAHIIANTLQDLGVAYLRHGRTTDASACLHEVVALRRSLGSPTTQALALNNLGYFYHLNGDYDQAIATFQEGIQLISAIPYCRAEGALLWSLADVRRDQGAFDEALQLYNHVLGWVGNSEPAIHCGVIISSATLKRWQGQLNQAIQLAERALQIAESHGIALYRSLGQIAIWAARSHLGEAEAAIDHFNVILQALRGQHARTKAVWGYGLLAEAYLLLGENWLAEDTLDVALQIVEEGGSIQPLVAETAFSPLLGQLVRNAPGRYDKLTRGLKKLRGEPAIKHSIGPTPVSDQQETYSLRVLSLGRERIERDGVSISPSDWRSSTSREIFFLLLFGGPQSRETISRLFWPDSSLKRVRSNFHTTLYRARQAVGENVISHEDGLYFIDPNVSLWNDALELEELVRQARLMPPRDARTEHLWRRAAELYQGDFLPTWDREWILLRRQSLFDCFIEALIGVGTCARARHNPREALAAFRKAIDADPFSEEAHRGIMQCYADLGEKRQIFAQFTNLSTLLREELELEPSAETQALAQKLLE